MARPTPRRLEAFDVSIPALKAINAEYAALEAPGESLDAYRQRRLPPRIWTLLVAVHAELLKKEDVRRPPQRGPVPEIAARKQTETDCDRLRRQTERARAARLRADREQVDARRAMVLSRFGGLGLSANAVARALNKEAVALPQGGRWTATAVLRLVTLAELAKRPPAPPVRPRQREEWTIRSDPRQVDLEHAIQERRRHEEK